MNDASPATNKFRRYRERKKAAGLREIRMWVPDVNAPGFQERLDAQIKLINESEDSRLAQEWIDEMTAELWADIP